MGPLTIINYHGVLIPAGLLLPLLEPEDQIGLVVATKTEIEIYEKRPES